MCFVCACACVSLWVPVITCVFTRSSHIPRFFFPASPQHTQTGVRSGESESPDSGAWPRRANITASLSLSHSLYSILPTVPCTEGLFVIQSRKCNWSQICPAFCLISSLLCSCRLPSPCALASVSETHGNKWSSEKTDLMMSWMSDFQVLLQLTFRLTMR